MIKARENPYRTECLESLLKFQPDWIGDSWNRLLDRWEAIGRFASVVGPHGTGKTTFLESIHPQLEARGYDVQRLHLRPDQVAEMPTDMPTDMPTLRPGCVLLLDVGGLRPGFRQRVLGGWKLAHAKQWRHIKRQLRCCTGVIETRHYRGVRPVLLRTKTTPVLLRRCIQTVDASHSFADAEIKRMFRRHRGNVRNALRECYDRC